MIYACNGTTIVGQLHVITHRIGGKYKEPKINWGEMRKTKVKTKLGEKKKI